MTDDAKGMPDEPRYCVSITHGTHWHNEACGEGHMPMVAASKFTALEAENERLREALEEYACLGDPVHMSDCALHNGPAMPVGPCDCGAISDSGQEKMPERVWLGVEQETVDGMPTGRDGDTYIEYEGWPEGTEYILASRFTALEAELHDASEAAYIYADMPKLRDRIQKMKDDMTYWHDQAMEHSALRDRNAERVTALEAENERLRKALDDLSTRCDCNELCACASDMMATAREALTPKGGAV